MNDLPKVLPGFFKFFFFFQFDIKLQGQKEMDELRMKLQEMSHLHEKAVNEHISSRSENEELSSQKV